MTNRLRAFRIAALSLVFVQSPFAEPIPPLPLAADSGDGVVLDPALPVERSPCTFDLDARWFLPLKTTATERVKIKVPKPVNCDGAIIRSIAATGKGSVTMFQFSVAFRPGHDRDGTITFGVFDDDEQPVALAEVNDNLDEGAVSFLNETLKIKNREFDRVFVEGDKPVMRITLRVEHD